MLHHVSIGVSDLERSKRFYDAALKPLEYTCLSKGDGYLGYGRRYVGFYVTAAEKPVPADAKSGLHFCFDAPDRAGIDAFHAAALEKGGSCNGPPGPRAYYGPHYYAAFVVDPDGYRLEAHCSTVP